MEKQALEQAQNALFDAIYVPMYVKTAASLGLTYNTRDELLMDLENAHLLKLAEAEQAAAQPATDLRKQANETLRKSLGLNKTAGTANDGQFYELLQSTQFAENEESEKAAALLATLS